MKVLVLGGGDSREREVSLRSAAAVQAAVERLGHQVGFFDPRGQWEQLVKEASSYEVVLPILHGTGGEDGKVQRLLDQAGVPYLGAGAKASELCFDKVRLKQLLREHEILTPQSEVVTAATFAQSVLVRRPFVLKPIADGSSVGTLIARTLPYNTAKADELLREYSSMLLEELIVGIELTVPVLGNEALPCIEIIPPAGGEFDYENKYNGATAELCPPKHVSSGDQHRAQQLAVRVHELAGVRHLSRTDIILTPKGELLVLEINTMPGLTDQSLFPRAAQVAGLDWDRLVARLVELAQAPDKTNRIVRP